MQTVGWVMQNGSMFMPDSPPPLRKLLYSISSLKWISTLENFRDRPIRANIGLQKYRSQVWLLTLMRHTSGSGLRVFLRMELNEYTSGTVAAQHTGVYAIQFSNVLWSWWLRPTLLMSVLQSPDFVQVNKSYEPFRRGSTDVYTVQ